jgi:hypothetical protein
MKKNYFIAFFLIIFLSFLFINCNGSKEQKDQTKSIIEASAWDTYTDPVMRFSVKYPTNWNSAKAVGLSYSVYTSSDTRQRTRNPNLLVPGAGFKIQTYKIDDSVGIHSTRYLTPSVYSGPSSDMIAGVNCQKYTFSAELSDGAYKGELYYATKDNKIMTVVTFEAFGGMFDEYKKIFDEAKNSIVLAIKPDDKVKVDTVIQELPPASQNLVNTGGDGFSLKIPDNFNSRVTKEGKALKSYIYYGERRKDCIIRVDIFQAPAKATLEKLVEQNKNIPGASGLNQSTLGNEKAFVLNYNPSKQVVGKIYFALKNDRFFRVIVTWFSGEENDYKPVFEKSIASFNFQ